MDTYPGPGKFQLSTNTHTVRINLTSPFSSGYRIGKGEGFADMEYAMMLCMGAVTESTVVVTIVHDCQVSLLSNTVFGLNLECCFMLQIPVILQCVSVLDVCVFLQVVDIPEDLIESHDITVDYILTPTRVIKTDCQRSKPQGVIWTKVQH